MAPFFCLRFNGVVSRSNLAIKNFLYLSLINIFSDGTVGFEKIPRIENGFSLKLLNRGTLDIGKALYSRRYLNIIVDGGKCSIGHNCFFNQNCSITCLHNIYIGNNCTFGNNLVIVDHDHNYFDRNKFECGDVYIGENTWVGANVVILKDTHIGSGCIIGAGAVVKGTVPDNTIFIAKRETLIKPKL